MSTCAWSYDVQKKCFIAYLSYHIAITNNMNISVTQKSMNKKGQSLQSLWVPTFIMHKNRYL